MKSKVAYRVSDFITKDQARFLRSVCKDRSANTESFRRHRINVRRGTIGMVVNPTNDFKFDRASTVGSIRVYNGRLFIKLTSAAVYEITINNTP